MTTRYEDQRRDEYNERFSRNPDKYLNRQSNIQKLRSEIRQDEINLAKKKERLCRLENMGI